MGEKSAAALEERLPDFSLCKIESFVPSGKENFLTRRSGRRVAAGLFRALPLWDYRQERSCCRIRFLAQWHTKIRMHPDGWDTEIRPDGT